MQKVVYCIEYRTHSLYSKQSVVQRLKCVYKESSSGFVKSEMHVPLAKLRERAKGSTDIKHQE